MKHILIFTALAALLAPLHAQTAKSRADLYTEIDSALASGSNITAAQLRTVIKNLTASADNATTDGARVSLTGSNTFLSGAAVTFNSGTTATFNGAVNMAPTSGTWDLSLLTITFGTMGVTTLNVTSLNIGADTLAAYIAGLINTSAKLRAILSDESGDGAAIYANGNIGAATATTPPEGDDDGSVATTEFVQNEIAGLSGGSGIPTNGIMLWPTSLLGSLDADFLPADGTEGTVNLSSASSALSVATYVQKTTGIAPTVSTMTVGTDGLTFTANMSENVTGTGTAGGGFALTSSTAEAITLGDISGSGTSTLTATASRTILDTETITGAYVPGDYVDGIGLPLAAFSGTSVTNNSEETGGGPTPSILWWKLNDSAGTTIAADAGVAGTTDGTLNSDYLLLDGSTNEASSNSGLTYGTNSITVSAWVYRAGWSSGGAEILFFSNYAGSGGSNYRAYEQSGSLQIFLRDGSGIRQENYSVSGLATNTWHHFAVVLDSSTSSGDIKLYINGSAATATSTPSTGKTTTSNFTNSTFWLGASAANTQLLDGRIDDVRIYSGEVSSGDISAIHAAGRQ